MAYSYQIFSVGDVLTAARMTQVEDNIRDHVHGSAGVSAPVLSNTPRQCVASAVLSAGVNNAISAGAGLNFNVDASPTAMIMTFAGGFDTATGTPVDNNSGLTVDASNQGSLVANNTNYLHATWSSLTAVTWGSALVPPQYGYTFNQTENSLLNFEGVDLSTSMIDDFGNTWTAVGNAQIDTAQFKFGTSSLLLDGVGDSINSANILSPGADSWEMSLWVRWNVLPTANTRQGIVGTRNGANNDGFAFYLFNNVGVTTVEFYASSGTTYDISNGTVGITTVWSAGVWYRFRLVFDALAGTYRCYLSNNGAAESQEFSVSSSARVGTVAGTGLKIGNAMNGTNDLNGWVDAFRYIRAATVTAAETPSASAPVITNHPVHFFSIPEMKMYEVTSASATAGVNPGLTARNRLFVGEADTGAATVTAVRNYAIRGMFRDVRAFPALNTATNINHNIGSLPVNVNLKARVKTSFVSGSTSYVVGSEMPIYNTRSDTVAVRVGSNVGVLRNSVRIENDSVGGMSFATMAGSAGSFGVAPFTSDLITEVSRGF